MGKSQEDASTDQGKERRGYPPISCHAERNNSLATEPMLTPFHITGRHIRLPCPLLHFIPHVRLASTLLTFRRHPPPL